MSEPDLTVLRRPRGMDDLAACCRWFAATHVADDPHETAQALRELYQHLTERGWIAPQPASLLLRLQAAATDAALEHLLAEPHGAEGWSPTGP